MHLRRLALALSAASVCAGCAPRGLQQRVAALEQNQTRLTKRAVAAEKGLADLQAFAADVEAVKAYFKQVADKMRAMRNDMVRLLDEQSMRVEEGRKEYVRILRSQEQVLQKMLPQPAKAIQTLEQKLPAAEEAVSGKPAAPALKSTPSPPVAPPQ